MESLKKLQMIHVIADEHFLAPKGKKNFKILISQFLLTDLRAVLQPEAT